MLDFRTEEGRAGFDLALETLAQNTILTVANTPELVALRAEFSALTGKTIEYDHTWANCEHRNLWRYMKSLGFMYHADCVSGGWNTQWKRDGAFVGDEVFCPFNDTGKLTGFYQASISAIKATYS